MADKFTDGEISLLIDGEASEELHARAQNPETMALVASEKRAEKALRQQLFRRECPSALRLGDYTLKRLPAYEVENINSHLKLCVRCREEVDLLKTFLDSPDERVDDAPVTSNILRIGPRYVATRHADVGAMRGNKDDIYAQLLEHDTFTIFLEARESPWGVLLTGQIVAPDMETQEQWTGSLIEIRQDPALLMTSSVINNGEFQFRGLNAGKAEIALTTATGLSIWLATETLIPDGET